MNSKIIQNELKNAENLHVGEYMSRLRNCSMIRNVKDYVDNMIVETVDNIPRAVTVHYNSKLTRKAKRKHNDILVNGYFDSETFPIATNCVLNYKLEDDGYKTNKLVFKWSRKTGEIRCFPKI